MTVPTRGDELDGTNTILISIYTKDFFQFYSEGNIQDLFPFSNIKKEEEWTTPI